MSLRWFTCSSILASYGTQENIIHFALRNRLNKTACYLIRNLRGYDHLYLEQDKNCKTPLDLAKEAGYHDLAEDITEKAAVEVKDFPGGKVNNYMVYVVKCTSEYCIEKSGYIVYVLLCS